MAYIRRSPIWPDPRVKPPFGAATIDWSHPLTNGLVLYVPANEGGGLPHNLIPRSAIVTGAGTTSWDHGAVAFGGASDVVINRYAEIDTLGGAQGPASMLVLARVSVADGTFRQVVHNDGAIVFLTINASNKWAVAFNGVGTEYNDATTPLTVGEDAVLVGTSSSGTTQLWKNGTRYENVTVTPTGNTLATWRLGSGNGVQYFNGIISTVAFWNRTLNDGEVLWLSAEPYAMLRPIIRRRSFALPSIQTVTPTVQDLPSSVLGPAVLIVSPGPTPKPGPGQKVKIRRGGLYTEPRRARILQEDHELLRLGVL